MTSCEDALTPRDSRKYRIFVIWTATCVTTFTAATILIEERIIDRGWLAWMLSGATVIFAVLAFRAYLVFLRTADELLRRIQVDALALGFGGGAVFMIGYGLFERLGAPALDLVFPFVVMVVFWIIGGSIAQRRYGMREER